MKKRLLSALLALCMVVTLLPGTVFAAEEVGTCGDNLTWVLSDDGTLTISGNGDMSSFSWRYDSRGNLITDMPWYDVQDRIRTVIIEDGVLCIGQNAFRGCSKLSRVVVSNTVKEIKYDSFLNCTSLNSIIIPEPVQKIDYQVFEGCSSLLSAGPIGSGANIEFGWTTEIPAEAFSCSSIQTVTFPEGISVIGKEAFYSTGLTEIIIPDSVTFIGSEAFGSCDELEHIVIPANASCEDCIFTVCPKLNSAGPIGGNYNIEFGWTQEIPDYAFCGMGMRSVAYLESVVLPNTITRIGISAFEDCTDLKKIEIPNGVTEIGDSAFRNCRSLQAVKIPSSLKTIDTFVFSDCDNLENVVISDGVQNLEGMAFGFANFTSIFLPKSIQRIAGAFELSDLTDVYYAGSKADWEKIEIIYSLNDSLETATIHFNCISPDDVDSDNMNPVYFLSSWDSSTRQVKFGDPERISPIIYTVADSVTTNINSLVNKYVLLTMEQGDSVLEYSITDIQPVESAIGTVTATGEHSFTIDGTNYPVREDYLLASHDGKEILYHVFDGTIMGFDVLELNHGTLEAWNSTTGRATINGTVYPTNYLSDLSFQDNIDEYLQKDVYFVTSGSLNYCPLLKITGIYSPGENPVDFDATVYHATWLLKNGDDNYILNVETPSDIMLAQIDESGAGTAMDVWRSFELVFDSLSDVTTLAKFAIGIDQKDMYSALILTALKAKVSYDIIPSQVEEGIKLSKSLISNVSNALKADYGIELNNDSELYESLVSIFGDDADIDAYLEEITGKWYKNTQPDLGSLGKSFKWISNGVKAVGTAEDYAEYISACIALSKTDEYIKEVLNLAYQKSSSVYGPADSLTLAFKECLDMFSNGTEQLFDEIQAGTITMLLESAGEYVLGNVLWGKVTEYINVACPEVAILQIGYVAGKTISSWLCNTDDAVEQYLKMVSITDIEFIIDNIYSELRIDFSSQKNVKTAAMYLSAMDFAFQLRDIDCDMAYKYVDAIDTSLLNKIEQAFGKKGYDELKNAIRGMQANYQTYHVDAETGWIFYLEDDYPGSGLYEEYEQKIDEIRNRILKKEITVACPVNVYVYDQSDKLVASVIDGRVSNSTDNVAIARFGEQKVVWLYNDADYRIEYVGSATGEMDISIAEFDSDKSIVRTVNYYGVALTDGKTYSMDADDETLGSYELVDVDERKVVDWDYDSMATSTPHTVKVISGTLQQGGDIYADTTAFKGETLQLDAYVPEGYEFVRWEVSSGAVLIDDPSSISTTMIMADEDIIVTAIMKITATGKITVSISNVSPASGLTYTGEPQQGYIGTPTSAYKGEYDILYTGRNSTEYNSATPPTDAGDYSVTIKVPDSNDTYAGGIALEFTIAKATQTAPAAPELSSKTSTSVSLKAVAANANGAVAEYSKDGGTTWQTSPTFTGLSANTEYSFIVRYSETKNFLPSNASSALKVQTSSSDSTTYTVTVNASPTAGGSVNGGGSYGEGESVTVRAIANSGYRFVRWTENGSEVSTSAAYTFNVTANHTLTAVFEWISNGGGGGGYTPSNPSYQITVPTTSNGTITVTPTSAKSGTKVTITATPNDGYTTDNVTVTDSSGKSITVTDNGDGTYTFTMPSSQVTISVTFTAIETPWVNPFTDVTESDWFYDGVAYAAQNGLMVGVGNHLFNPSGTTSRGMIVTILYRLEGEPAVSQSTFTDVEAGQYYTDAVAWAAANNIVAGYGNNTFGPNDDISREQIVTILYRYADYKGYDVSRLADLSRYTDKETISSWALTAMRWANREGLMTGRTTTALVPKGNATRAEVATILKRFCLNIADLE